MGFLMDIREPEVWGDGLGDGLVTVRGNPGHLDLRSRSLIIAAYNQQHRGSWVEEIELLWEDVPDLLAAITAAWKRHEEG